MEEISAMARAAIEAHTRLEEKNDMSFYNIHREGARWLSERAQEWIKENISDYVSYDGEIDKDLFKDFKKAMTKLTEQ